VENKKIPIFPYTLGKRIVFFLLSEVFCVLKYAENAVVARWGSSRRSPRPIVGWGADTPPHTPTHSAPLAPRCSRLRRLDLRAPLTPNPGDATGCVRCAKISHNANIALNYKQRILLALRMMRFKLLAGSIGAIKFVCDDGDLSPPFLNVVVTVTTTFSKWNLLFFKQF